MCLDLFPALSLPGILGADASVELYFADEIRNASNPEQLRRQRLEEFTEKYSNPMREVSANWGVEDVIEPKETRKVLIQGLGFLDTKKKGLITKRHGNIPV